MAEYEPATCRLLATRADRDDWDRRFDEAMPDAPYVDRLPPGPLPDVPTRLLARVEGEHIYFSCPGRDRHRPMLRIDTFLARVEAAQRCGGRSVTVV